MRAFWKEKTIISIKLNENIFSLAQMFNDDSRMVFFNIFSNIDKWENVDLNRVEILFSVDIGNVVIQKLGQQKTKTKNVLPFQGTICNYMISPHLNTPQNINNYGEYILKGGDLYDVAKDTIVKENLNTKDNREDILKYEVMGNYGGEYIRNRILFYREYKINYDANKNLIFPGLYSEELTKMFENFISNL